MNGYCSAPELARDVKNRKPKRLGGPVSGGHAGSRFQVVKNSREASDAEVSVVVAEIACIDRENSWNRNTAIGRLILDKFFEGDPEVWRARRGRDNSLRRLASHPGCPLKKSALALAVGVHIAVLDDASLRESEHVTPSHVACVLSLEEAARRRLLREAEEQSLSVRDLAKRVRDVGLRTRQTAARSGSTRPVWLDKTHQALALLRGARLALEGERQLGVRDQANLLTAIAEVREELALFRLDSR